MLHSDKILIGQKIYFSMLLISVWGTTWEKCKGMLEAYDYLFEIWLKMKALGT